MTSSLRGCTPDAFLGSPQRRRKIDLLLAFTFGQEEVLPIILNQTDQLHIMEKNDLPLTPINYFIIPFSI